MTSLRWFVALVAPLGMVTPAKRTPTVCWVVLSTTSSRSDEVNRTLPEGISSASSDDAATAMSRVIGPPGAWAVMVISSKLVSSESSPVSRNT